MTVQPLTQGQVQQYEREGFLLVSGLVPEPVAAKAEEAMWRLLEMRKDDPSTWRPHPPFAQDHDSAELLAVYTPAVLAAAAQLAGEDVSTFPVPKHAHALNAFPETGSSFADWRPHGPHIDHSIPKDRHRTFPRAFRVACMHYLVDCKPHGGNTVVWPRSHMRMWLIARSDPERYEFMAPLGQIVGQMDFGRPLELVPRRGEVLFYEVMCVHCGSTNVVDAPRFALNTKW